MPQKMKNQWDIPSYSNSGKVYKVTIYEDNTYTCSCPQWFYQKKEY